MQRVSHEALTGSGGCELHCGSNDLPSLASQKLFTADRPRSQALHMAAAKEQQIMHDDSWEGLERWNNV
ncbi:hypothetical protein MRB53_038310 [Persea americana]|nr:hypothetical protein MRB53_038310 [Persea americana]